MFNEKETELGLPVVKTPRYFESKKTAIKFIQEQGIVDGNDFWILMNKTKSGDKMLYSGVIISHNGCLKINDKASDKNKFRPECVKVDANGFNNSLVFTYCNAEQGIYEVGEVSKTNCKNEYPYAMGLKRLFDRVVLKLCKLAYYGVYSDSEAEEFKEPESENVPRETIQGGEFIMPAGEHEGKALKDIPQEYLCFYLQKGINEKIKDNIKAYQQSLVENKPIETKEI